MTGLRPLRPYVEPEWRALLVAAVATIAVVAAWLARPLPLALVVDRLLDKRAIPFELEAADWRLIGLVAGLVVAIALVNAIGSHLADDRLTKAGERITHRLRLATYVQLQRLSLTFHDRRQAGDLVTRVTSDASAVGGIFPGALGNLTTSGMLLLGMLAVSVIIDPWLALTAFAAAPALAWVSLRFRKRVKAMARRQRAKEGEIASLSEESISGMRAVKAFGAERYEEERLRRHSEELLDLELEASSVEGRMSGITDVLGAIALALVLVVGVVRVAAGAVSVGELVIMWTYARRIDRPLRAIARNVARLTRGLTRAERVAEILAADEVLPERPGAYSGPRARGDLDLEGVSFSYEGDRPALADLTLRIPAGERVALMGPSGAGKSTLTALLARFYDPPEGGGRVLIDGRDLRDCSLEWLRSQVGLVLQDTVLFTGSVAENIAYGREADRGDVVRAAKLAGAHAFISELPQGYDTPLGPRAVGLSGGQRQRISVARTFLRDPPILVLDEPTTGLDRESEARVLDGLETLARGRTTVMITHSHSLAATAQRVVVVDAGRVVGDGPPENVLGRAVTAEGRPEGRRARFRTESNGAGPPPDPALPRMPDLLDTDVMAGVLAHSLGEGATPPVVRVRSLRYRPRWKFAVCYDVGVGEDWHHVTARMARGDLARQAGKPQNIALARLVDGRSPAAHPLFYEPTLGALIQWLPLDLALPALAEPAATLRRRLHAAGLKCGGADAEPSLLKYRPHRRAVFRLDGHVLKFYAKNRAFVRALAGLRRSSALRSVKAPDFRGELPEMLLTVQAYVDGSPVSTTAAAAGEAGALLDALHRSPASGLEPQTPARQLEVAARTAGLVSWIAPELRDRVRSLVAELDSSAPAVDRLVPSHGDFSPRQLLEVSGDLFATDFDAMCLAPPSMDLVDYTVRGIRGEPGDLDESRAVLDLLLDGYGDVPDALDWYLATAIVRRSANPFRLLEEHWRERINGMVEAAEAVASR